MICWKLQLGRWQMHYGFRRRPMPRPRKAFWIDRRSGGDGDEYLALWMFRRRVFYATWWKQKAFVGARPTGEQS